MALEDTRNLFEQTCPLRVLHFPAIFDDRILERSSDQLAETRRRFGIPEQYVLVCNQFWLHKNHIVVCEALRHTRDNVHVVMTGEVDDERWPDYATQIRMLLKEPSLRRRITMTGRIDRTTQIDLMMGALGFLQPSRFEGWSTFVEEARALGRAILLSEFPVHREQSPPESTFFDPDDAVGLAALLDNWFVNPPINTPSLEAHHRHRDFVLACARTLLDIARFARAKFHESLHDPKPIAAGALSEIACDITADRHGLAHRDRELFEAAIRQLFLEYPKELASLTKLVCDEAYPLYPDSCKKLISATLAKMTPGQQEIFHRSISDKGLRFRS
jgi:glycosyltransferase involved in cell wall biosynthesis